MELIPVRNVTLRAGAAYVDSEFTSYPNARAPKYSFNVGGDYVVPTSQGNYTFSIRGVRVLYC